MASAPENRARIGISGWNYPPWRGVFYPEGLRHADELPFASQAFATIEINGSFYSLKTAAIYTKWFEAVPEDFVFMVKGGRYVTHLKQLRDPRPGLANFFASGLLCLGHKLGPILWQLPPRLKFEPDRLRAFLDFLPRDTRELEALAKGHDPRLHGKACVEARHTGKVRHAFEVRHPSFLDQRYVDILREYGVASCVADTAGLYPVIEDLTTDFVYVRLHGSKRLYTSGYSERELSGWAGRIKAWLRGADPDAARLVGPKTRERVPHSVYVYFDNDVKVRAPFDAQNLERLLRGERPRRLPRSIQSVTEEPRVEWR